MRQDDVAPDPVDGSAAERPVAQATGGTRSTVATGRRWRSRRLMRVRCATVPAGVALGAVFVAALVFAGAIGIDPLPGFRTERQEGPASGPQRANQPQVRQSLLDPGDLPPGYTTGPGTVRGSGAPGATPDGPARQEGQRGGPALAESAEPELLPGLPLGGLSLGGDPFDGLPLDDPLGEGLLDNHRPETGGSGDPRGPAGTDTGGRIPGEPESGPDTEPDAGRPHLGRPHLGRPDAGPDTGPEAGGPEAGGPEAGGPEAGGPEAGGGREKRSGSSRARCRALFSAPWALAAAGLRPVAAPQAADHLDRDRGVRLIQVLGGFATGEAERAMTRVRQVAAACPRSRIGLARDPVSGHHDPAIPASAVSVSITPARPAGRHVGGPDAADDGYTVRFVAVADGGRSWTGYLTLDRVGPVLSVLWHLGPRGAITPAEATTTRRATVHKARPLAHLLNERR